MLVSLAMGTGLRLAELLGLNVGDLRPDGWRIRRRMNRGLPVKTDDRILPSLYRECVS